MEFLRNSLVHGLQITHAWIIQQQKSPELFALNVWSIWNQQNQVQLHQPSCSLHLLAQLAKDRL